MSATSASNSDASKTVTATCPTGKTAIGGGAAVLPAGQPNVALLGSRPSGTGGWTGEARELLLEIGSWSVQATVSCAVVSP